MRPLRPLLLVPACAALLAACASAPRERVATEFGIVRAPTVLEAESAARRLESLAPRVRALLPGLSDAPVELWVLAEFEEGRDAEREAYTWVERRRIHIHRQNRFFDFALAHELVHAWMGGGWRALPGIVEEGLADHVGLELSPRDRAYVRASRLFALRYPWARLDLRLELHAPAPPGTVRLRRRVAGTLSLDGEGPTRAWTPDEGFAVSATDLARLERRADRLHLRGLGFFVVDVLLQRVGYRGLLALCERERGGGAVGWRELADAAGLGAEPRAWRAAFLDAWGADELRALAEEVAPELAAVLAAWIREAGFAPPASGGTGTEGASGLDRMRARLGLHETGRHVELLELPAVRTALVRALAGPAPARER